MVWKPQIQSTKGAVVCLKTTDSVVSLKKHWLLRKKETTNFEDRLKNLYRLVLDQ